MDEDLDFGQTIRGFAEGQVLAGRYELRHILGRGGMGVVWLARDRELERDIAIKFLPEMVARDPEAIKDLKRETRRSLDLTHPNVVRIHDFVQGPGWAGISMEYVDGPSLSAMKAGRESGCFDVEEIRPWLAQLFDALSYAHERARIVHRDLKPHNLMLTSDGQLKVADFGISSSITDSMSRVSVKTGTSGSPPYMSPQQVMGELPRPSDDIYSLGATIYDLLAGKPPFHRGNIYAQIKETTPLSMTLKREELGVQEMKPIPAYWEATVALCLAKKTEERPRSVQEVLEKLEKCAAVLHEIKNSVRREPRNSRALITAGALVLGVGILCGWWFGFEQPRRQHETQMRLQAEVAQQEKIRTLERQSAIALWLGKARQALEQRRWDDAEKAVASVVSLQEDNSEIPALRQGVASGRERQAYENSPEFLQFLKELPGFYGPRKIAYGENGSGQFAVTVDRAQRIISFAGIGEYGCQYAGPDGEPEGTNKWRISSTTRVKFDDIKAVRDSSKVMYTFPVEYVLDISSHNASDNAEQSFTDKVRNPIIASAKFEPLDKNAPPRIVLNVPASAVPEDFSGDVRLWRLNY